MEVLGCSVIKSWRRLCHYLIACCIVIRVATRSGLAYSRTVRLCPMKALRRGRSGGFVATVEVFALLLLVQLSKLLCQAAVVRVGVLPFPSAPVWLPTFQRYLNEAIGEETGDTFEAVTIHFGDIFSKSEAKEIDFVFTSAFQLSCLEAEFSANILATFVRDGPGRLPAYYTSGVIFTNVNNTDINTLSDIVGKTLMVPLLFDGLWQVPQLALAELGINIYNDPLQVRIQEPTKINPFSNVLDVIYKYPEDTIGFGPAGILESVIASRRLQASHVKVLTKQSSVKGFPYLRSIELFPEFGVASFPWVDFELQQLVQEALLALNSSHYAAQSARYQKWIPAMSYYAMSETQRKVNWMKNKKCQRSDTLYDSITCLDGYFKLPKSDVDTQCALQNAASCPEGWLCVCSACQKVATEAFQVYPPKTPGSNGTASPCSELAVCFTVSQLEESVITVEDNLYKARDQLGLPEAKLVDYNFDDGFDPSALKSVPFVNGTATLTLHGHEDIGLHLLQLYVDNVALPDSPFVIDVIAANCEPLGSGFVASANGTCVCQPGYVRHGNRCVPPPSKTLVIFLPIALGVLVLLLLMLLLLYRHRRADASCIIQRAELKFADPLEVLGQGKFGVVLKAEFRGTTVAVKKPVTMSDRQQLGQTLSANMSASMEVVSRLPSHRLPRSPSFEWEDAISVAANAGAIHDTQGTQEAKPDHHAIAIAVSANSGHKERSLGTVPANGKSLVAHRGSEYAQDVLLKMLDRPKQGSGVAAASASSMAALLHPAGSVPNPAASMMPTRGLGSSIIGSAVARTKRGTGSLSGRSGGFQGCLALLDPRRSIWAVSDFMREIRLLVRLRHPNIISILGACPASRGQEPLMVMELMEHGSLRELLQNETISLDSSLLIPMIQDIVSGMRYLHSCTPPVLHKDLKAANILVDRNLRTKISDFGLSSFKKSSVCVYLTKL